MLGTPKTFPSAGKTFRAAIAVFGVAAFCQVVALVWVMVKPPANALLNAGRPDQSADASDSAALSEPILDGGLPTNRNSSVAQTGLIMPPPRPVPVNPTAVAKASVPDTRFQELVEMGKMLRDRGDMGNALTRLREARALDPFNPAAVAEIAITYEKMGLADKAAEHWKKILDMGDRAGSYYVAADARLKQSQAQAIMAAQTTFSPSGTGASPGGILYVDQVNLADQLDPEAVKHFNLQIGLRLKARVPVDVRDVVIQVLFYDIVDGTSVVQTSADVNSRWVSAPPDWSDSDSETLEVEYHLPKPSRGGLVENRKYFGYSIRLYYKGQLQDTRSEPAKLAAQFRAPETLEKDPQ